MKRLIDLFERDRFTFTPEGAEKLGLKDEEKDTVFVVVVKYSQDRILIGDTRTGYTIKAMEKREAPGDLEIVLELSLASVQNLVKYVQITFDSTDLDKSLIGFFYLKQKGNKLELTPKLPTISLNWNGYVQSGFPVPILHLTRIAGVWVDLLMNINKRIKAVEFLVPDMGQVRVTFNFID